jgi:hypothetical protein
MKKTPYYVYLGENGTILSTVKLPDIYKVQKYNLEADKGYVLTKDNKTFYYSILVPAFEVDLWQEIENKGQV